MWGNIFLALALITPLVLLFLIRTQKDQTNKKLIGSDHQSPPGPTRLPIIGNFHQLGSLPHRSLRRLSRKYGPVMLVRLGEVNAVVVSSAEAAAEVLKTRDAECCSRPSLSGQSRLSYNGLDVAFSPYGDHWKEVRKICVLKLLTQKKVQSFGFVREEEILSLVGSLRRSSASSSPVDLEERAMTLTASVVFRIAFGKRFGESGLDNETFRESIHRAQEVLGSFAGSDFFRSFGWVLDWLTGFHARLEKSFRELDDFCERLIGEHCDRDPALIEHEDMVDLLLKIERDQEVLFTRNCTKAILMDIFFAGIDTSAISITWAMAELARNPRVMKKAQEEIRNHAAKNNKGNNNNNKLAISESEVHKLQYLKMVVKETLRLHPPAPLLIPRETLSRIKLVGYEVPAKTMIQVNVWAIGRDPNYWDDPEEFFPERFDNSSIDYKGNHFELLPFGSGRRGCPGIHMAMATVELALANLLCSFDWKLPDGTSEADIDMEEGAGITIYKKSGLKLVPIGYRWPLDQDSDT